jgi:hypothetical protein
VRLRVQLFIVHASKVVTHDDPEEPHELARRAFVAVRRRHACHTQSLHCAAHLVMVVLRMCVGLQECRRGALHVVNAPRAALP